MGFEAPYKYRLLDMKSSKRPMEKRPIFCSLSKFGLCFVTIWMMRFLTIILGFGSPAILLRELNIQALDFTPQGLSANT